MTKFCAVAAGALLLAFACLNAGCSSDNSNNANAARQASVESNNTATPAQSTTTTQATQTVPAPASTQRAGGADVLPITDAAAFRDKLLEIARGVKFDSQSNASSNADAIRAAWLRQYPNLKFSLFYSMPADPTTVSSSDTFLISGAAGNFDQLYAFAVFDTKGKCAAGAGVIPGDNANRQVSNEKAPSVFKSIDMSRAKSCTGEAANDNYKP